MDKTIIIYEDKEIGETIKEEKKKKSNRDPIFLVCPYCDTDIEVGNDRGRILCSSCGGLAGYVK